MSTLDNPTAPPAAVLEPPAAPLDGIELAAKAPPNTSPMLPRKLRPQPRLNFGVVCRPPC